MCGNKITDHCSVCQKIMDVGEKKLNMADLGGNNISEQHLKMVQFWIFSR